jgi:hypothetical protein
MKTFALALAALSAVAPAVLAQSAPSSNKPEARRHFQEGVQNAQRGDLPKALLEFEAAYAVQPNFSVLYNIGQAHAALGHAVEAVVAFERYLSEGGEQVAIPRREEVQALISTNRQRIGTLRVVGAATASWRVWIDGSEIPRERLANPLPLVEGAHSILYAKDGCSPVARAQPILAGKPVEMELTPAAGCSKPLTQLAIDCDVPDVEVEVVGVTKARTPLDAPLLLPVGDSVVQFRRPGYAAVERRVQLDPSAMTRLNCEQRALQPLPPNVAARLVVQKSPKGAQVLVDGQPFSGEALPAGSHQVVVTQDGFVPQRRLMFLEATKTAAFSATLQKTVERQTRDQASASRRKRWGLALGGAGVAFLGTAGGLYGWNSQRYTDWRDNTTNASGPGDINLATSVQRIDDLSFACALLGVGLGAAGTWLFFASE